MASRKKRRIRSPHPGVKLKKRVLPSGAITWRAVFEDPDSGREVYLKLDPAGLPTAEMRTAWAKDKAKTLARRRMQLESGAARDTGTALAVAVKKYFEAGLDLRPRTVAIYRGAADKLEAWCEKHGVESADQLTRPRLIEFREALANEKKRAPKRKGKRGNWEPTSRKRSPAAVNQELRAVRTVLGYLHEKDLLPRLTYDDLRRGLKLQKAVREAPEFLRPEECRKLLEAALRHDGETHAVTRAEHRGERAPGTTERFEPIAPLIAFCLLTGCRAGEGLALRWRDVHLDTVDADGRKVGEIHLRASAVKTGHARKITLDVAPGLRALLAAMKLQAGDDVYVFGGEEPMSRAQAEAARKRLVGDHRLGSRGRKRKHGKVREIKVSGWGAPAFSWQLLRSTCATVSCNAPSLWGTAAPFVAAKRLGHSVVVSEKRYAGQLAVSAQAKTLEDAMQVRDLVAEITGRLQGTGRAKAHAS